MELDIKRVSKSPVHTAEHILNCSLPYKGKFTLIGNATLLPVLISPVG